MNNNIANFFTLSDWLNYLKKFRLNVKYNCFKNVIFIAKKIGILKLDAFIYIVGGTNGKGTTCFVLEKMFLAMGYRVGLYTSPHLFKYTERVRINGCELDENLHISAFITVENARSTLSLTYYDFITLSALYLFKYYRKLDIVILEVGVGGRLDATNIIDPDVSVITNIAIDHIEILGKNRDLISIEKSGILRKNKIAIISEKNIPRSIQHIIKYNQVNVKLIHQDWNYRKYDNNWAFISKRVCFLDLPIPKVSLINTATALAAITESNFFIKKSIIKNCINHIQIPGRYQILSYNPTVILDVAHNFHATQHLFNQLIVMKKIGKIHAIVGILKTKNIVEVVTPLISIVDHWYCIRLNTKRSASEDKIMKCLPIGSSKFFSSINYAWKEVQRVVDITDIIIVFGSFVTVREISILLKI
ncbi:MAG: bifunctional tetrahydrofolate synthase/dihydrofolate synthase [Buchnera aphidicola (Schlechtendalia peitan)]